MPHIEVVCQRSPGLHETVNFLGDLLGRPFLGYDQDAQMLVRNLPGMGPSLPGSVQEDEILAVVRDECPVSLSGYQQMLVIIGPLKAEIMSRPGSVSQGAETWGNRDSNVVVGVEVSHTLLQRLEDSVMVRAIGGDACIDDRAVAIIVG
jgi:hypothetical protein